MVDLLLQKIEGKKVATTGYFLPVSLHSGKVSKTTPTVLLHQGLLFNQKRLGKNCLTFIFNRNNCMAQWLIGIFVRLLSSKDEPNQLCGGVGKRTLSTSWVLSHSFLLILLSQILRTPLTNREEVSSEKALANSTRFIGCDDLWCIKLCHFVNSQTKDVFSLPKVKRSTVQPVFKC